MEDEMFISSISATRENPRSLGFAHERLGRQPTDSSQRTVPPILDRFRAMIRDREDEIKGDGDESPLPPDGSEIVRMYEELLSELTFNSKPIITELTMIAGEQREHAMGIVDAICARIDEVPQDQKLPSLYLLDSIVKNIGEEYVKYFNARLPKMFCQAYNDVHSGLHPAMHHLFRTWSHIFSHSALSKIEDELKFTAENQGPNGLANMRNSETRQPSHGIHVNPKYLESQHQFEIPVRDTRHSKEYYSGLQASGNPSFPKYNEHDLDQLVFQSPNLRTVEGSSQNLRLHESSMVGPEGPFTSSQRKVITQASPTRIELGRSSPQNQRFQTNSVGKTIEPTSWSHSELEIQPHKASESNGWPGRSLTVDSVHQQPAALTALSRYGRQRQRELIDAYGNYKAEGSSHESFPKIQRVDENGMKGRVRKMDWQNSEEEEYLWEDMSPTLANTSKRSDIFSEPSANLGLLANNSSGIDMKSDFRRRSWPAPPFKDSTTTIDDRSAIGDYGLGLMNRMHHDDIGSSHDQFRRHEISQPDHEHLSLPHALYPSTQDNHSPQSQGMPFKLPYMSSGVTPSFADKRHSLFDNLHNAEAPFLKLSSSPDSLNLEMPTLPARKVQQPALLPPLTWPTPYKYQPLQLFPTYNLSAGCKPIGNQQPNFYVPLSQQQFDANGRQLLRQTFQETHGRYIPSLVAQTPAKFAQPLSGIQQPLGQSGVLDSILMPIVSLNGIASMPPLPPGPPPLSSQPLPTPQNSCSAAPNSSLSGFSGLISSLMKQGLISLAPSAPSQNAVGLEFNADLLKIRHESAINAMYSELPRQCTTCGLRFTCQEDHSSHMDWHVTKNRLSKNRKQKPSRKWFVSSKEWLCGAETLGADAVPGFLPTETAPEKNEDREIAVPANENQTACALCGEPFEDFYSDETEEWMYRGAVYLNAPNGNMEDIEHMQMGPIVHVKCRPEPAEGLGQA